MPGNGGSSGSLAPQKRPSEEGVLALPGESLSGFDRP
jgi:hypothetical protein